VDVVNEQAQEQKLPPISLEEHREIFFDIAKGLGVTQIHITFSGSGDDGCIDECHIEGPPTSDDAVMPDPFVQMTWERKGLYPMTFRQLACHLAEEVMEKTDVNFNNEGCHGDVTFHIETRKINVKVHWPIVEYETNSFEL
jgi:hypothetical protein